jgi:hypothetical protein
MLADKFIELDVDLFEKTREFASKAGWLEREDIVLNVGNCYSLDVGSKYVVIDYDGYYINAGATAKQYGWCDINEALEAVKGW